MGGYLEGLCRRPGRVALLLTLAAALLGGCGEDPETELEGRFGPGNDSALYTGSNDVTVDLTRSSGSTFGEAQFDDNYFDALGPSTSSDFETLIDSGTGGDDLTVVLSRITGRPDTPCRFQAAVLARDEDFDIEASGERENSRNIAFYQVNLKKGGLHLSVFCAELKDEVGVVVQVVADTARLIRSEQVHFILNSIRGN